VKCIVSVGLAGQMEGFVQLTPTQPWVERTVPLRPLRRMDRPGAEMSDFMCGPAMSELAEQFVDIWARGPLAFGPVGCAFSCG
jgi:hypothetical protein